MGANAFVTKIYPASCARKAFREAIQDEFLGNEDEALARKEGFIMINDSFDGSAKEYAWTLIDEGDARIDDKWGPAGCIKTEEGFVFFGWASDY